MENCGMKINDNYFVKLDAYAKNIDGKTLSDSSKKQDGKAPLRSDEVVLSPRANELRELKKAIDLIPDIREEKILMIKSQIEKGTYQVDGKKIAGRMLKES
jgi:negative regulator of flagellin synthesis FlgM